jgi:hypothetical protein
VADPELSPDGAVPLTSIGEVKRIVPARPGVYAAWIDDERALKAAGIDGPSPRCVYIGKAQAAGLSSRIGTHVASSFPWLNEMLAARRLVLFNWVNRFRPPMRTKYYVEETRLAAIANAETRGWQHAHLRWSWKPVELNVLRDVEREAIHNLQPVLNITHAGSVPPQLRAGRGYPSARARWLWHASWLGLLLPRYKMRSQRARQHWPQSDTDRRRRGFLALATRIAAAIDETGFLLPAIRAVGLTAHSFVVRWPSRKAVKAAMRDAAHDASRDVRAAVADATDIELLAWWAAHAGAPHRGESSIEIRDALALSLSPTPATAAALRFTLPNESRRDELLELVACLHRTRH